MGRTLDPATQKYIQEEAATAIQQLKQLSKKDPPVHPLGQINPKPLKECRGIFFYHTTKVGLGVGVKWGRGWLLMRTGMNPPRFSPPVFYKVAEGSIGFTAGAGGSATLIALGTDAAVEAFCSGKAVLGDDSCLTLLGKDADASADNVFDRSWKESIAWTIADGLMVDASLTGGRITVDKAHNTALYGQNATPTNILITAESGKEPEAFKGVYELLHHIIKSADKDPRKFSGFQKHWSPQPILGPPKDGPHMATGAAAPGTPENPLPQPESGKAKAGGKAQSEEETTGLLSGPSHAHQA